MIEVRGLGYSYPGTSSPVLKEVDFEVKPGEFLLVMGRSGSGKSTLARALCRLVPDFYGGHMSGQVLYKGRDLREWGPRSISAEIAMLFQEAGQQIIYNQVERDIAFGLENLGIEPPVMKRRVAEAMDFFDLNHMRDKNPAELSGGELRRVALAGVLVMQPRVLIPDEPSSQLDPLAAEELLNWLKKLNAEMGTTIIMVEQRLDKAFPLADRVLLLEQGRMIYAGIPSRQPVWAKGDAYPLMPTISYIMSALPAAELPLTVKEGRGIIRQHMPNSVSGPFVDGQMPQPPSGLSADQEMGEPFSSPFIHTLKPPWRRPADNNLSSLSIHGLHYGYSRKSKFFENLNMEIAGGESVVLLGANGAGKSTLMRLISGILQPKRCRIMINRVEAYEKERRELCAYLPQSVDDFFLCDTVREEIQLSLDKSNGYSASWLELMGLSGLTELDPRKLSVGEKQRVALACLLASALFAGIWGFVFGWLQNLGFWIVYIQPLTFKSFLAAYAASFYFDLAHAVSNIILCILFFPSVIKVLEDYKMRLHHSYVEAPLRERTIRPIDSHNAWFEQFNTCRQYCTSTGFVYLPVSELGFERVMQ